MSLAGKTVLLTRRHEQAAELVELLEARGAKAVVVPAIEVLPARTWDPCDEALERLPSYTAVLLTSANAAVHFLGRARELGKTCAGVRVITIGEATRKAAASCGVRSESGISFVSARALARHLLASPVAGHTYLFPCGDLVREELPAMLRSAGARVDQVEVYRTVAPAPERMEPARTLLTQREVSVLVFGSPSAVKHLRGFLGERWDSLIEGVVLAAIGETTAGELRACARSPEIVARQPKAVTLVSDIEQYFESSGR